MPPTASTMVLKVQKSTLTKWLIEMSKLFLIVRIRRFGFLGS